MKSKIIKEGDGWYLMEEDTLEVMGKTLYRLIRAETGEKGGYIGLDVEMDKTSWVDNTSQVLGKVTLRNYTQITDGSKININPKIPTLINNSELNYTFIGSNDSAFTPTTQIKIVNCRFDFTELEYKATFPREGLVMENCKFMRWKKFGSATTLHLTSGIYKNVTGDNVCHIELHFGQVDEGAVDRVIMEDVHLRTQGKVDIRGVGLVYLNNVVVNSDAVLEHLSDLNHLIVTNENVTKEWKRLEL
jgi:hypothetical protein